MDSLHHRVPTVQVKVKLTLQQATKGPEGEKIYNPTLSLTLMIDMAGGQRQALTSLSSGKIRYTSYRRLGGPQSRSGWVRKIPAPSGILSPERPAP